MADSKISALTSGNPAQSGDEIPIARGGANYKITAGSIALLGGDVDGPASSVDNQIALFDSTTGKLIKAATTTGVLKASSGVIAAATSGTDYVAPAGAFSGLSWQSVQTTGFTAVAFRAYPCNTTSAAFTVTLPASPSAGDQITLTDYAGTWSTNNLTVGRNGNLINGAAANAVLSTNRGSVQFVYVDSTQGWVVYAGWLPPTHLLVDYVVVGGGGGGGDYGGGGGGGFRTETSFQVPLGVSQTLTVGAGGAGAGSGGNNGASSVFSSITSTGGGGGGSLSSAGKNGGSGGGGGVSNALYTPAGSGNTPSTIPSQGNNGGTGALNANYGAGGGGGAGAAGSNGTDGTSAVGGNGGDGAVSTISGSSVTYAGGGGGGAWRSPASGTSTGGVGGAGGGGNGQGASTPPTLSGGSTNTGGGGGGAGLGSSPGGNGGSGVVIIKIPSSNTATFSGGVTSSVSTAVAGFKIYTVTATSTTSETVTFS